MGKQYTLTQLSFAGADPVEEDGLVWKEVLKTGRWETTPGPNQQPVDRPFIVTKDGETSVSDKEVRLGLDTLMKGFEEGAMDSVTVPLSHNDGVLENTGFVRKLKIEGEGDEASLMAGIEFTEPEVKEKAKNGSLSNTSCGILFDYMNKGDKKVYPAALAHVAHTPRPWLSGLAPFKAAFSEELPEDDEVQKILAFSHEDADFEEEVEETEESSSADGADEGSDEEASADSEENVVVEEEKSPLELAQAERQKRLALAEEADADSLEDAPEGGVEDMDAKELQIKLSEEKAAREAAEKRAREAERKARVSDIEARVLELGESGLDKYPGTLKEIRKIMLSDDGQPAVLLLSEETGKEGENITATDIVERVIASLPHTEDGKLNLSEQALVEGDRDKPKTEEEEEEESSVDERTKKAQEFLDL